MRTLPVVNLLLAAVPALLVYGATESSWWALVVGWAAFRFEALYDGVVR